MATNTTVFSYQGKFTVLHRPLFLFKWHENLVKLFIPSMLFLADRCATTRELLHIVKWLLMLFSLGGECLSKELLIFLLADVFNLLDQVLKLLEIVLFIASIR